MTLKVPSNLGDSVHGYAMNSQNAAGSHPPWAALHCAGGGDGGGVQGKAERDPGRQLVLHPHLKMHNKDDATYHRSIFFHNLLSESFRNSSRDWRSSGAMTELTLTSKQPGKY